MAEPKLPTLRISQPPPKFAVGSRVLLKSAPFGEPGEVIRGAQRNKIAVHWRSLRFTGYYKPDSLVLADQECRAEGATGRAGATAGRQ